MNFLNPLIKFYFTPDKLEDELEIPFHREITWLFSKNLDSGLKMSQNRVNINFVDSDKFVGNMKFESIYEHRVYVNSEIFGKLDLYSKKEKLLDILYEGFISLATEFKWDKSIITHAYNECKTENLEFIYHTKFKQNRNRIDKGRIAISLRGNIAIFHSELFNIDTNSSSITELLSTNENNFSWSRKIRDFGWLNKSEFGLKLMSGQLWIISEIGNPEIKEIIKPTSNSKKEIQRELDRLREQPAHNNG